MRYFGLGRGCYPAELGARSGIRCERPAVAVVSGGARLVASLDTHHCVLDLPREPSRPPGRNAHDMGTLDPIITFSWRRTLHDCIPRGVAGRGGIT